jgi:hypothetical protein
MEKLQVSEVSRLICKTNKGDLVLQLRKGEANYKLVLDAVPLAKDLNDELMDVLFSKTIIPQVNKDMTIDMPKIVESVNKIEADHIDKTLRENVILKPKSKKIK